ncbi:ferrous iron transport protein A [Acidaminococcus sp. NSJ-142]|jgi:ferrous iron transport protein A|uniref:FeoA family protein n=1 Tax=Acidaminococcus TaxID=904 RepID=UPI000CF947D0|nr:MULTISPECIES: FeoA family protein [Acidaminococcus]MCD2436314.1 ferrous iron transport protein A [Acidaminococcus hominis]MCH4097360.1 ferrous iron transport protein A [Acidaminococcus provencensis]RHJ99478.1 ferrous iron transport protein A [Acidaminococcus sp. AM05-11]
MPLNFAEAGVPLVIARVGGTSKVRSHLENLGITLGAVISIVQHTSSGLILNIRDSRVAISTEMAGKIIVQEQK